MSIQAVAWVLEHSQSRGYARLVLIALANHCDDRGVCWPSFRTVARQAGVSLGAAHKQVGALVALGEVEVLDAGHSRRSATYHLPFADLRSDAERSTDERSPRERSARAEVNAAFTPAVNRIIKKHHESSRASSDDDPTLIEAPAVVDETQSLGAVIQRLVAGYCDDYTAERPGKQPPQAWRAAAGRRVREALENGEDERDIAVALGVVAHESKNPGALLHVLADKHVGRERRTK